MPKPDDGRDFFVGSSMATPHEGEQDRSIRNGSQKEGHGSHGNRHGASKSAF